MHPFWDQAIRPLLDAAAPRTVVEIGAERGYTRAARARQAELDAVRRAAGLEQRLLEEPGAADERNDDTLSPG